MANQTCEIDGVVYEAAERPNSHTRHLSCTGCAGMRARICKRLPPCSPHCGRTDGKVIVWVRREVANG